MTQNPQKTGIVIVINLLYSLNFNIINNSLNKIIRNKKPV